MKSKSLNSRSLVMTNKMFIFAIPALLLFITFWIFPILQLFAYSVTDFNGIDFNFKFVGINNYVKIFQDGSLVNSISNTLKYTVVLVVVGNVIALSLALALNAKIKGLGFYRSAAYLPTLFSAIVVGFIWSYVYMPDKGMIASILNLIGMDGSNFNILGKYSSALYGISIVDLWKNVGSFTIIYLAGLQTIDENLLEAGRIDGCHEWNLIRRIKIPLLSPAITINVILSVISGLKAYDYAFIMTNGGPGKSTNTLMFSIYKYAFIEQKFGKASAFSVISFFVIVLITIGMLFFMNKREVEL